MLELWKELFTCDPEKGLLFWHENAPVPQRGKRAGYERQKKWGPRRVVRHKNINWYEHRIIWTLTNGEIPKNIYIDHINGDACDNRILNLRLACPTMNSRNRKLSNNNTSGTAGVHWDKRRGLWKATIYAELRHRYLGQFKTKEEAIAARKGAEKVLGYISR